MRLIPSVVFLSFYFLLFIAQLPQILNNRRFLLILRRMTDLLERFSVQEGLGSILRLALLKT